MGTDSLFHKKKARSLGSLQRSGYGDRKPNERTLIVCEDAKSSRYYFMDFCKDHKLEHDVQIITCPNGNDPFTIVKYAKQEVKYYKIIYCVFDNDRKPTIGNLKNYQQALNLCNSSNNKIIAINSVQNFEYWLLLHYVPYLQPFAARGKCTVGECVIRELKKYINDYTKDDKSIYETTKQFLWKALKNADHIEMEQKKVGSDNPSTKIHWLIRELRKLK